MSISDTTTIIAFTSQIEQCLQIQYLIDLDFMTRKTINSGSMIYRYKCFTLKGMLSGNSSRNEWSCRMLILRSESLNWYGMFQPSLQCWRGMYFLLLWKVKDLFLWYPLLVNRGEHSWACSSLMEGDAFWWITLCFATKKSRSKHANPKSKKQKAKGEKQNEPFFFCWACSSRIKSYPYSTLVYLLTAQFL